MDDNHAMVDELSLGTRLMAENAELRDEIRCWRHRAWEYRQRMRHAQNGSHELTLWAEKLEAENAELRQWESIAASLKADLARAVELLRRHLAVATGQGNESWDLVEDTHAFLREMEPSDET